MDAYQSAGNAYQNAGAYQDEPAPNTASIVGKRGSVVATKTIRAEVADD